MSIKGANVEVNTDSQGVYYLANIGSGNTALTVSYTGLNTVDLTVAVRTGGVDGDQLEVLAGLNAGERVVLSPPPALAAGASVVVRP